MNHQTKQPMRTGLLGEKLSHSFSPQIHKSLAGDRYSYELFERAPEEVEAFIKGDEWDALNVTIPYKQVVMPYLDVISDEARRIGAVNTITRLPDGRLGGDNTDYFGFARTLTACGCDPKGKKALVLGNGGAAATAVTVLTDMGAEVVLLGRSDRHVGGLSPEPYETVYDRHPDTAVVVNCTPVGMYPNNGVSPLELSQFPELEGVLDLIYNPARTQLLLDCERYGIPGWSGLWMLVAQAKQSAQWFMNKELPDSLISDIHRKLRDRMENIALIGMAGCGKSTLGRQLAKETGKQFVDADAEVERLAGKTIPEIFADDGEEEFRRLETAVLAELGRRSGLVIATGGGCVTRERNYPLLHQNSRIIWIKRAPGKLPTAGRPLSQKTAPGLLYDQRRPLYKAFSDAAIDNDGTRGEALTQILNLLEVL